MRESCEAVCSRVLDHVRDTLAKSTEELAPWFFDNMPDYYFRTHSEEEQARHLQGIISGQAMQEKQDIVFTSPDGGKVTYLTPGADMGTLVKVLSQVADKDIQTARVYASRDGALRLDTFLFAPQCRCDAAGDDFSAALDIIEKDDLVPKDQMEAFKSFLSGASQDYVQKFECHRAVRHFGVCKSIIDKERVIVELEENVHENMDRVAVAMIDPHSKGLLLQMVKIFARKGVNIHRAYGDVFEHGREKIGIFSFYVKRTDHDLVEDRELWEIIRDDLRCVKWFPKHDFEVFADQDHWPLREVMLLQAAGEFAHQILLKTDLYAYTSSRIVYTVLKYRDAARLLIDFFHARFDPSVTQGREELCAQREKAVLDRLEEISNDVHRNIFRCILDFFKHTLRTNYYLPNHFGLGFRLDPAIVDVREGEERPFGIYCFHGPYCFGFQVRYRDMARGGVRVVRTWSQEQFELESNRLFDEVTQLASAQQAKNKDIPEGGSKAVILLGPDGLIDLAVKAMADSLLDLMLAKDNEPVLPEVVDYLGREEIIYLGPDENITPDHINWIVDRAEKRGYRWPSAIMSSKPKTGINHKEYGVTSEGVVVFSEEALKALGINPRTERFTVKLTGGPAGDVASNCMKILIREYGDNAVIVAMSDGHGAAHDPEGLDHAELLRLIESGGRAHQYDKSLLRGEGAFVASTNDPGGVKLRDELHNTAEADIFIPSGGRPDTINIKNWHRFLKDDGNPSSTAIVEGANIFISPAARDKLEEHGVMIVPGPSANKTGVICSSYEILAGLTVTDREFLDMKPEYVDQVLSIIRKRARDEAKVLMREYKKHGRAKSITAISRDLSRTINALGDIMSNVIAEDVDHLPERPRLVDLVMDYCPKVLADNYGSRLIHDLPRAYQRSLLSSFMASRILYMEGLDWFEGLVKIHDPRQVVFAYLDEEKHVNELIGKVTQSGMQDWGEVADILKSAGRKHMLLEKLNLS